MLHYIYINYISTKILKLKDIIQYFINGQNWTKYRILKTN